MRWANVMGWRPFHFFSLPSFSLILFIIFFLFSFSLFVFVFTIVIKILNRNYAEPHNHSTSESELTTGDSSSLPQSQMKKASQLHLSPKFLTNSAVSSFAFVDVPKPVMVFLSPHLVSPSRGVCKTEDWRVKTKCWRNRRHLPLKECWEHSKPDKPRPAQQHHADGNSFL